MSSTRPTSTPLSRSLQRMAAALPLLPLAALEWLAAVFLFYPASPLLRELFAPGEFRIVLACLLLPLCLCIAVIRPAGPRPLLWASATALLTLVAIGLLFTESSVRSSRTFLDRAAGSNAGGDLYILGADEDLKPHVAKLIEQRGSRPSTRELLEMAGWQAADIWEEASIARTRRQLTLLNLYGLAAIALASFCAWRSLGLFELQTASGRAGEQRAPGAAAPRHPGPVRILYLAANPAGTKPLQLEAEAELIRKEIQAGQYRDSIEIHPLLAASYRDLRVELLRLKPDIVHFSGHGSADGIYLLDESGAAALVSSEALEQLFRAIIDNINLIFLNSCRTGEQIGGLTAAAGRVISMEAPITDRSAILFASSFYSALSFGRTIKESFDVAQAELTALGRKDQDVPQETYSRGFDGSYRFVGPAA